MNTIPPKRILVAPLDWGLGHTTRCIPIIRHLLQGGHEVIAAGNETQQAFLRRTFPQLKLVHLAGYEVQYSRSGGGLWLALLGQLPRLLRVIGEEHRWLQALAAEERIDGIISDNRYGLHHDTIPSVIITHQPGLVTRLGKRYDALFRSLHYSYLKPFGQCWLVDMAGMPNLAGGLSHPDRLPENAQYIGLLSQMQIDAKPMEERHLLILLSGPEPQRTILSDLLWEQVKDYQGRVVFVEGPAAAKARTDIPEHIGHYSVLTAEMLQPLMEEAFMVICRSGYSTLMDLCLLEKKAILIPTPGQTEQEYLGRHLDAEGMFLSFKQKNFSLTKALKEARHFPFHKFAGKDAHCQFIPVLNSWLGTL